METPQKYAETPQLNKDFEFFFENGNASKISGNASKKRGNNSTINIGKRLKNIQKSVTLFQFRGISQNKNGNSSKAILEAFLW